MRLPRAGPGIYGKVLVCNFASEFNLKATNWEWRSQQINKAIVAACDVIGVPKLKAKQRETIGEFVQGHGI